MFEWLRSFFRKTMFTAPLSKYIVIEGDGSVPDESVIYKAWVVLQDGRVGYIDHYKQDGRFGVRPVNIMTGRHYLNTSAHWTPDQRLDVPEELALQLHEFRAAQRDDIPVEFRSQVNRVVTGEYA